MTTSFLIAAYFLGIAILCIKRTGEERETFVERFGIRVGHTLVEFLAGAVSLKIVLLTYYTITSALTE